MLRTLFELFSQSYARDDFAAGEVAMRSLLRTVPGDAAARQLLGLVYFRTGRHAAAVQVFDAAAPLPDPVAGSADNASVDFLARNGYSAAAACRLESTRPAALAPAWYDLGITLSALDRHQPAVNAFRCALAARPDFALAQGRLNALGRPPGEPMRPADPGKTFLSAGEKARFVYG